jgi:hypothetical protein
MAIRCEVCGQLSRSEPGNPALRARIRRLLVEDRVVRLCDEHAARFRLSGGATLAALRALFPEPSGRRSLVERRTPLDRRAFPPRPEGRRRGDGRRDGDAPGG